MKSLYTAEALATGEGRDGHGRTSDGRLDLDLAIIDGVETIAGGEGPWIRGVRVVQPGVLIAGLNPVCTDAVAAAVMGYNPRASRGTPPFRNNADNTLLLAEAHGVGAVDLSRIEVRGASIADVLYRYDK